MPSCCLIWGKYHGSQEMERGGWCTFIIKKLHPLKLFGDCEQRNYLLVCYGQRPLFVSLLKVKSYVSIIFGY